MFCLRTAYFSFVFFFNATPTTEIYTLSLHDALPISAPARRRAAARLRRACEAAWVPRKRSRRLGGGERHALYEPRSEEHTSELQSQSNLVCRLLLEKKKNKKKDKEERTASRTTHLRQ